MKAAFGGRNERKSSFRPCPCDLLRWPDGIRMVIGLLTAAASPRPRQTIEANGIYRKKVALLKNLSIPQNPLCKPVKCREC
jgi:hypothetical protein